MWLPAGSYRSRVPVVESLRPSVTSVSTIVNPWPTSRGSAFFLAGVSLVRVRFFGPWSTAPLGLTGLPSGVASSRSGMPSLSRSPSSSDFTPSPRSGLAARRASSLRTLAFDFSPPSSLTGFMPLGRDTIVTCPGFWRTLVPFLSFTSTSPSGMIRATLPTPRPPARRARPPVSMNRPCASRGCSAGFHRRPSESMTTPNPPPPGLNLRAALRALRAMDLTSSVNVRGCEGFGFDMGGSCFLPVAYVLPSGSLSGSSSLSSSNAGQGCLVSRSSAAASGPAVGR